jgi:hypothetical protein
MKEDGVTDTEVEEGVDYEVVDTCRQEIQPIGTTAETGLKVSMSCTSA